MVSWASKAWLIVVGSSAACAGGAPSGGGPVASGLGSASSPGPTTDADDTSDEESSTTTTSIGDDAEDGDETPLETSGGTTQAMPEESSTGDPTDAPAESSTGDDTSVMPECPNEASCDNAEVVGMVSGDEGSPDLQVSGNESTWLTFQVTEDNDSVVGEALSFTATLSSPPGTDYDLFVYRGAANGPTGCGGVMDSSTSAGANDVVHMSWGEGGVANGGDDRSWIAVEIVVKGEACPAAGDWTLLVEGDS